MMTDPGNGVYNLLVRNVTITDDALYQCQVSPGPAAGSKPIRSSATLSVLSEYHHRITAVLSFIIHTHIRIPFPMTILMYLTTIRDFC